MNLRNRVTNAEKWIVLLDEDGPITVAEIFGSGCDREHRRQIGPARVRDAVLKMREMIQRCANFDPTTDAIEGDDRSHFVLPIDSSENVDSLLDCAASENLGDTRE